MKHACTVLLATLCLLALDVDARAQFPTSANDVAPADAGAPAADDAGTTAATPSAPAPSAPPPSVLPPVVRAPQLTIPLQLALRERRLARDLEALGERGSGRVTSAIVQLGVGAAFATLGAVLKNEIGRSLLLLIGAGTMAHGGFQLALHEDADGLAAKYLELPMMTPGLAAERVEFGERALASIARGAKRGRIADGTVTMTIAAVYVPLLWWLQTRADSGYRFGDSAFDYVALALSGINFATGMVTALVSTDAERRWSDYKALRARVTSGSSQREGRALGLRFLPTRAGAMMAGGLRF